MDEAVDPPGLRKLAIAAKSVPCADRCWCSPALRAVQTAEALHLDATIEPMLRDCDYGRWTGRSLADVQAEEPGAVAEWLGDPATSPHGGESMQDVLRRVAGWLDAQRGTPGRVVAVTHPAVIRAAIIHAIEATPRSFWRIDIAPLSVATLSASHGPWTLTSMGPMAPGAG